jgi:hypothetical protein
MVTLRTLTVRLLVAATLLASARHATAQSIRGTITESQSGRPVAGAVVLLMDSIGVVRTRAVSSELGTYSVRRAPEVVRGQVLRLGFRPRLITPAELAAADASGELTLSITAIPQMLEPVTSRAGARCPRRRDSQAAFGFWEQAKAALMASVYAREDNPGLFTTLTYERFFQRYDTVVIQKVAADAGYWTRTFTATFSARDFVETGFVRNDEANNTSNYFGPDAEVLLENDFQIRYCFSLAARDPKRPTQVGLHFAPVRPQGGRTDIEGNFWIDTASRKLNEIVYEYVGLRGPEGKMPGGVVRFRELANGIPFVDSWNIRMASLAGNARGALRRGGAPGSWGSATRNASPWETTDGGGVLAHAVFPDSSRYDAPLGAVRIRAMSEDGKPMAGVKIELDSTIYRGVTDSNGVLVLADLLEGPYETLVLDSTLDAIGLRLRSPLRFHAIPDSTVDATLFIRDPAWALANTCQQTQYLGWAFLVARVATPDNKPVQGAHWAFGDKTGVTKENGVVLPCNKLRVGDTMDLFVWRDRGFPTPDQPLAIHVPITSTVTALKVELRPLSQSAKP